MEALGIVPVNVKWRLVAVDPLIMVIFEGALEGICAAKWTVCKHWEVQ